MSNPDPYLNDPTLMRGFVDAVLPKGSAWQPKSGGDLDLFLDGFSDGEQAAFDFLTTIGQARNPLLTPILDDLEREFGITPDATIPTATRRQILSASMFSKNGRGTAHDMQRALDSAGYGAAGYGLQVIENSPAVDPHSFSTGEFQMIAGGTNAYAGYYTGASAPPYSSFAAVFANAIIVVNGVQYTRANNYICCGNLNAYANNNVMVCGYFNGVTYSPVILSLPYDATTWPFVFFVGGTPTYAGDGSVTAIEFVDVPRSEISALERIILSVKPIHSWCVLCVNPS